MAQSFSVFQLCPFQFLQFLLTSKTLTMFYYGLATAGIQQIVVKRMSEQTNE